MRETFDDIGSLLGYYQFIKLSLTTIPSILPKKDFGDKAQKSRAKTQQMSLEDKYAFVGDVELFPTNHYYHIQRGYKPAPPDCLMLIFHFKFCPALSRFQSYEHLALHFRGRIKKEPLPKRLAGRVNLFRIASDMSERISPYFIKKGYLKRPNCNKNLT